MVSLSQVKVKNCGVGDKAKCTELCHKEFTGCIVSHSERDDSNNEDEEQ